MIDERKVLKHSWQACYVGIVFGVIMSLITISFIPLIIGSMFSLCTLAIHYDLKRFIKKEQNQ